MWNQQRTPEDQMKLNSLNARLTALAIPFALLLPAQAASVVVTPSNDGDTLVNSILGSGITLVSGSVSYTGANTAASGTFTGGAGAGIGIANGLIMTSGYAASAVGPNDSGSTTGPGFESSLTFKFTTTGGNLFFNYVFASEEYNEYVFSAYNDKFKFLLDGTNIALVPGTSTPVEIDTVNTSVNSAYYNNNASGAFDLEYDGFTDVFTASALGLSAGEHTITLQVYDVGDSSLDSAVFIQGNSFSDKPTTVPDGGTSVVLLGTALLGLFGMKRKA
jgi:hypothetical protein